MVQKLHRKCKKREEDVVAMSEGFKKHFEEALKMREEVTDDFAECRTICDEADVILEAKRSQEETPRRSFQKEGEIWNETRRKHENISEKLCNFTLRNGTKSKNFLNDWDEMLALASETKWKKQINEMAKAWVTTASPQMWKES